MSVSGEFPLDANLKMDELDVGGQTFQSADPFHDGGGGGSDFGPSSGGDTSDTSGSSDSEAASEATIGPNGPVDQVQTVSPVTIVGPPDFVLQNPEMIPVWDDMQDGWDAAEHGVTPDGPQSDAFWLGYRGYIDANPPYSGPAADVAPDNPQPLTTFQDAVLKWLEHDEPHAPEDSEVEIVAD